MKYFFLALLTLSTMDSFAFRLITNIGAKYNDSQVKVYVTSNSTCDEIGISNTELLDIAMEGADDFWNKVPTSNLKIKKGGILETTDSLFLTGVLCASDSDSNCSESTSVPSVKDIVMACNSENTTNFPSTSYLAISAPISLSGSDIKGSVILINNSSNTAFKNLSRSEMVSVLAHELGHAVGLGHSNKSHALMYYKNSDKLSKLSQDDIDGISYLYPNKLDGCTGMFGTVNFKDSDDSSKEDFLLSLLLGVFLSFLILIFTKSNKISSLYPRRIQRS